MNVIEPLVVTDAVLTASNIAETDHPQWNVSTAYSIGQRVILVSTHSVYEAVVANTGQDPADPANIFNADTNPAGEWLRVGATNRWKAFDGVLSDPATRAESITYSLTTPRFTDSIAFLNVQAETVRVVVRDVADQTLFVEERVIADTSMIVDWFTYFTWDIDFDTEVLFTGLPAYAGHVINITITAPSGVAQVGQIALGRNRQLGDTMGGTEIGIRDFSRKDRDDFGNAILIVRGFIRTVNFNFVIPVGDERRVQRILSGLRAVPSVYYANTKTINRGTLVYGFFPDFNAPLSSAGVSFASLEVESLS